ncbi:PfkB family carbohydrate kinase, partial [Micromonospora zhanjiangensis]
MTGASRIVVVGDVVTDVLAVLAGPLVTGSDTRADIRLTGGGQAANTAAWLARLGAPVTLVGAVG